MPHILIIDDAQLGEATVDWLRQAGHQVTSSGTDGSVIVTRGAA